MCGSHESDHRGDAEDAEEQELTVRGIIRLMADTDRFSEEPALDDIERQIVQVLEQVGRDDDLPDSNPAWTCRIKDDLMQLGTRLGFEARANKCNHGNWEWMLDLVWLTLVERRMTESIDLAMESEWARSFDQQLDDFAKLVVVRASHRLFVLSAANKKKADERIDALSEQIAAFESSAGGERYLFAAWIDRDREFLFRLVVHA